MISIKLKWKRPKKASASVSDLRQMYTYCRFWDAEKAMLLYPGELRENKFQTFKTEDYSTNELEEAEKIKHQCKMGFVSVLDSNNNLDLNIGEKILKLLDINLE